MRLGLDGSASGAGRGGAASSEQVQQNFVLKGPQERAGAEPASSSLTSLHLLLTVISPSSHSSTHSFTQPSIHLSVLPIQTSVLLLRPLTHFTVQCLHTHAHTCARTHEVEGSLEKSLARMFIAQHFQLSPTEHILQHDKGITPCVRSEVVNSAWLLSPVKT